MALANALCLVAAGPGVHARRPLKAMEMKMLSGSCEWASIDADIQVHLKKVIPIKPPYSVYDSLRHLAFSDATSSSRTAPALCIAVSQIVGGRNHHHDPAVLAAASALWLVHAAACAHERLLSPDKSPEARPSPYEPSINLLIGDGMLPLGMELLANSDDPTHNNSDRVLRVVVELTRGIGSLGVIQGKLFELEHKNGSAGNEWIRTAAEKVDGRFNACAAACGAILGGGSEFQIEKLRKFGLYVGKIRGTLDRIVDKESESLMEEVEKMKETAIEELGDFITEDELEGLVLSLIDANFIRV